MEIARHAGHAGHAIDDTGISATIAAFGLPLIGADTPDYALRARQAADRWMRDRWLGPDDVSASKPAIAGLAHRN
jgi:hypothetical protein